MYSTESLERGIVDIEKNIVVFEQQIVKEKERIVEYRKMIDALNQKKTEDKALGNAKLLFSNDFNGLHYVYVIQNLMKEEQQNLVNEYADE